MVLYPMKLYQFSFPTSHWTKTVFQVCWLVCGALAVWDSSFSLWKCNLT